jgi:hypothetical protein
MEKYEKINKGANPQKLQDIDLIGSPFCVKKGSPHKGLVYF